MNHAKQIMRLFSVCFVGVEQKWRQTEEEWMIWLSYQQSQKRTLQKTFEFALKLKQSM